MGNEANAMTVDSDLGRMHERSSRSIGRRLIGARFTKSGKGALLEQGCLNESNGDGLRIVCGSHRLSPLLKG
jgi:hypothetical protein